MVGMLAGAKRLDARKAPRGAPTSAYPTVGARRSLRVTRMLYIQASNAVPRMYAALLVCLLKAFAGHLASQAAGNDAAPLIVRRCGGLPPFLPTLCLCCAPIVCLWVLSTQTCCTHLDSNALLVPLIAALQSARGRTQFCVSHGGGKRCAKENCSKSARGRTNYCVAHGGGKVRLHCGCDPWRCVAILV